MEPILRDDGLDRRDLGDLMEQRLGVLTGQVMAAAAAVRRPTVEDLVDLLWGDQDPGVTAMAGLSAPSLAGGSGRRSSLDSGRVGGRGLGGVGGVLVEAFFEAGDPLLELDDDPGDDSLGLGREDVPDGLRDRSRPGHATVVIRWMPKGNPGRGRLPRLFYITS
jgi:hypothetical protein